MLVEDDPLCEEFLRHHPWASPASPASCQVRPCGGAGGRPWAEEALRRWLLLDDGRRQLAIIGADCRGMWHEYTPGELSASLLRDPPTDHAQITGWRSS